VPPQQQWGDPQQQWGQPQQQWGQQPGYAPYAQQPGGYQPYGQQSAAYAGFGSRLFAFILDGLIVGIPFTIVYFLAFFGLSTTTDCRTSFTTDSNGQLSYSSCRSLNGGFFVVLALLFIAGLVVAYFYYIKPVASQGQTLGMRVAKVRVVDAATGQPGIGIGRTIGRYLARSTISGWICYLGFFWMLFDDRNQTWHDKIVNTIVVTA